MTDSRLHSLRPGWIYEVVITAKRDGAATAGPFGLWTGDGATLEAALFKGSSTLEAIRENGWFVANFVDNPLDLHGALNRRDQLVFDAVSEGEAAGWPVLADVPAWLGMRVTNLEDAGKKMLLTAEIVDGSAAAPVKLINRAKGLFLESLVLSTRCRLLGWAAVDQLRENVRVIAKVAPGSGYETAVRELLAKVEGEC
ncbi:hypothetical protein BerOc1_00903 [Pseudodesulfovibrio hydrargyri]|uniref:DUF447 domain-containing protein n=1 Tax=Pseudodesulfovibrio hydrargyri TaxID=2125990 RepID=A0A1J5MYF9_9BACT|nr:DUF447 domain-containing protein [Pseudodesulfovibrio hydrargyri]OIQ51541.1 hypothetical protein BerOc1_00903 [Pseudodesulfovibrio hydrargyri]